MNRQCYWLHELEPSPDNPDRFRVCVVTESELGYRPTGHGKGADEVFPWYWDHATCVTMNAKHFDLNEDEVRKIILSSMFCNA